jgi:hypothetical protein
MWQCGLAMQTEFAGSALTTEMCAEQSAYLFVVPRSRFSSASVHFTGDA